jgi:hypothetical protein
MTLSATAQVRLRLIASQLNAMDYGGNGTEMLDQWEGNVFTGGTAANQVNLFWADQRTINPGANETLNLKNASLTNGIGNAVAMDVVKAVYIENTSTALTLKINGAATTVAFTSANTETIDLPPGAWVCFCCGTAAAWDSATNVGIKIAASAGAGTLTYNIVVIGVDS